jgi:hypothetical protein
MPVVRPSPRAGPPPRIVEQHTRMPVRAVPLVEAESRTATRPQSSGVLPVWRPRTVPYSRPAAPARAGPPARAQPGNAGVWRQQLPVAQQPRPSAPAAQYPRPSAPAAQPVRQATPVVRQPDARPAPAPRAERDDRGSSGRPHAQPLNEARDRDRK